MSQAHCLAEQDAHEKSVHQKSAPKPKKQHDLDDDISAGCMSADKDGSDGSFNANLNKVLKEGAADVQKGK